MTDLAAVVKGKVTLPDAAEFAQARQSWNLAVDQGGVHAVVEAADAEDVAALVRYARKAGLAIATQPSGHGASGNVDGVILLRTNAFQTIEIDPARRVANVGAGVKWGQLQSVAGTYGLTGLTGSSPVVSVAGYTLGGGLSWFGRKFGAAAHSVLSFDIVDSDGTIATVTEQSDPDLFWALRGGGGDFAIVTALEFKLHPAPELFGGRILWPASQIDAVLEAYQEVTQAAPDELSVWFGRANFPGVPPMVAIDSTYLGQADEAVELLRRFDKIDGQLSDTRAVLPITELGSITAEPTDPTPGKSRSELLTSLDTTALSQPLDPLFGMQIRHLGGALTNWLDANYYLFLFGAPAPATSAKLDEVVAALGSTVTGRKPFTGLTSGERAATAFSDVDIARLRAIKRARDPQDVFRSNFPVLG